ncbi:MAG: esterase family protein [Clostridia bacterium]|nr:esterase family protein [Clostridia bacterium]
MFLEMNFYSNQLKKQTQVYILLPDINGKAATPCKTLWLFHGLEDNHTSWMRYTSIERYAAAHNLAVIMPNVDRGWYTDTAYGTNYFSFVTKELPELCFKTFSQLSRKREDNIAAGLSMGGYGAVKTAFSFPEQYGSCISLSGALDITTKDADCDLSEWKSIFGLDIKSATELKGSKHDLCALSSKVKSEKMPLPKLYLWCGTEDDLLSANLLFDQHLTELGISHRFETSEGNHSWKWWDRSIQKALDWILND